MENQVGRDGTSDGLCQCDTPDPLQSLCLQYIAERLECIATYENDRWTLQADVNLPQTLCERLLSTCGDVGIQINDSFLHLFHDPSNTHLRKALLRNCEQVTDTGLEYLLKHGLTELDISQCTDLSPRTVLAINKHCRGLNSLLLGTSHSLFRDRDRGDESCFLPNDVSISVHFDTDAAMSDFYGEQDEEGGVSQNFYIHCTHSNPQRAALRQQVENAAETSKPVTEGDSVFQQDYIFDCPNLRMFSLHNLKESNHALSHDLIATVLNNLTGLRYLDISGCEIEIEFMDCIENLKCLTHLILYGVPILDIEVAFQVIGKVKTLRHLDLGQGRELPVRYAEPEKNMALLLSWLPYLNSLDLSGTNLAGHEVTQPTESLRPTKLLVKEIEEHEKRKSEANCFPAFKGRTFEFLGLLNCAYKSCERQSIPAKKVTGDANEDQMIASLQAYIEKSDLLIRALNDLFQVFRQSTCKRENDALQGILNAMKRHLKDRHVQISGSASVFYIVKGEEKRRFSVRTKRKVICALLNGMEEHLGESTMMRNCCLTLCHFSIPQDVIFAYKRIVSILLRVVDQENQEEFVQRIGIYLLNSLACQVDGTEKQMIGDLGGISTMLKVIRNRLSQQTCDEVMEIAWSTMWNVTDETPLNCERFIQGNGMQLFKECLQTFKDRADLLRNMMGLMGNIAEVDYIRPKLMTREYIRLFSELLQSNSDGIEVSYNAAGVLAHMFFDGPAAWSVYDPSRHFVAQQMTDAILQWDINSKRNINYRSFEPILRLVRVGICAPSQHWAIWALCNLTRVYPNKYCPLLVREGGVELLEEIAASDYQLYITEMSQEVIDRCRQYQLNKDVTMSVIPEDKDIE